ncbi:MAG: ABC transporter ATP-binding protein [Verrucomicrobia bacterium]|nr:ABC transporter ATP-binding protein [Verrucomicrobiota bacterium]
MIVARDLRKSFAGKEVLRGLNLRAQRGAITLLVGANGAGKSTTMKILAGLVKADRGSAHVNRIDIAHDRLAALRSLSYLPQSPSFHARLTGGELLRFYGQLRGVAPSRPGAMLELAGVQDVERVRTAALSGGMRQRLGLALLLLPDAPVLLLDEPGLSLDPRWRKRLQEILQSEAERGKTVLVTTHLIAEWNGVADHCLLCREGRIECELHPNDLPHDFEELERFAPREGDRENVAAV